jgi:hypothetical protein
MVVAGQEPTRRSIGAAISIQNANCTTYGTVLLRVDDAIFASFAGCGRFWTNERSILSTLSGIRRKYPNEEKPVPKSSM